VPHARLKPLGSLLLRTREATYWNNAPVVYTRRCTLGNSRSQDLCLVHMEATTPTLAARLYVSLAVRREYSSPGHSSSTSTSPCIATTRHPAARALCRPRRAPRLLVPGRRLYVNLAVRREYSSLGRSGYTSTTPHAAATSSSGRMTTSTTYLD
jgi:hypothetical protein